MKTNLKNEIPRAVIYTRVSSKDQLEGFSLESQEKICKDFALRNGWEVAEIFR
jgi:site-specific DNA recombinase